MNMIKFKDLVVIRKGRKSNLLQNRTKESRRYIQIEDLRHDNAIKYTSPKKGVKVTPEDILIAWDGANAGTVSFGLNGYIGSTIAGMSLKDKRYFTPYVGRFLQSRFNEIRDNCTGAAIPHVNKSHLLGLSIPIPFPDDPVKSLAEQRRISTILDKADAIRKKRAESLRLADEFLKSTFLDMFGEWLQLPLTDMSKLGDSEVSEIVSGVTKGRRFGTKKTVVVPYIRVANVQDGFLDLKEIKTIEVLLQDVENLALQRGDVLMTEGGDFDKLGRGAMWDADIPDCIHQNHVFRIRCNRNKLLPEFLAGYIQTGFAKAYFLRCAKKTSNLASINMTQLRATPIPCPPIKLQLKYAAIVKKMILLSDKNKGAAINSDSLFNSLVHKAFRGEL